MTPRQTCYSLSKNRSQKTLHYDDWVVQLLCAKLAYCESNALRPTICRGEPPLTTQDMKRK